MLQENVDLVRRYIETVRALMEKARESGRAGISAIDLPEARSFAEQYWHPEAVFDVSNRIDGGLYHAPAGVMQAMRDWFAGWEDFDVEAKEFLPAGDRVVVVQDFHGTAKGGMKVEVRDFCAVMTTRQGRFVHYEEYPGRGKALEAVGLRE